MNKSHCCRNATTDRGKTFLAYLLIDFLRLAGLAEITWEGLKILGRPAGLHIPDTLPIPPKAQGENSEARPRQVGNKNFQVQLRVMLKQLPVS